MSKSKRSKGSVRETKSAQSRLSEPVRNTAMEAAFKRAMAAVMQAEQIPTSQVATSPFPVPSSKFPQRRLTATPALAKKATAPKVSGAQRPSSIARPEPETDNRKQRLERRLAGLADAYEARMQSEADGCKPSVTERQQLEQRIQRGQRNGSREGRGALEDVVLGIDFGSTSTKIVARLPFVAGKPAVAMPVPACARAEGNPYLWSTRIWSHPDGRLSLLPFEGSSQRSALKTRLLANPADLDQAFAAFFLGQIISYARDWATERLGPIAGGRSFRWSYNFGFPADSLDKPVLLGIYRRVIAASLNLSGSTEAPTIAESTAQLAKIHQDALSILVDHSATIQPEVVGAVAAALEDTNLPRDLFMMVDVGGVTVDCCTFKYIPNEDGDARMPIYRAKVESLGAECEFACRDDAQLTADLRESLLTQMRIVIWDTYQDYMLNDECWRRGLPILMVGGGAQHSFYRELTGEIHRWLLQYLSHKKCPGVQSNSRPSFPSLVKEVPLQDEHRLCVATGLSNPDYELPEIRLSREIAPPKPREVIDFSGRFIGPEMT
jgi:hypothetical protein